MPDTCMTGLTADGCWDPAGECTVSIDTAGGGTEVSWDNGAKTVVSAGGAVGVPGDMAAYGSSGEQCFTMAVTGGDTTTPITTIDKDGDKKLTLEEFKAARKKQASKKPTKKKFQPEVLKSAEKK